MKTIKQLRPFRRLDENDEIIFFQLNGHGITKEQLERHLMYSRTAVYVGFRRDDLEYGQTGSIQDTDSPQFKRFVPHGEKFGFILNIVDLYFGDPSVTGVYRKDRFGRC